LLSSSRRIGKFHFPIVNLYGYFAATREEIAVDGINIGELVEALIEREGGYVRDPADRGGATCFGITEAVARAQGYGGSMRQLPREEAARIYTRLYWLRPRFDEIAGRSPSVAAELFDTGVNMGPAVAATFLQRALTALNRNAGDYGNYILDLAKRPARRAKLTCGRSTDRPLKNNTPTSRKPIT
jgi:hypothetical protein